MALRTHPALTRSRELARNTADHASDALRPLITVTRGLHRLAASLHGWWIGAPQDRRGPALLLAAGALFALALLPYGLLCAVVAVVAAACWAGRDGEAADTESTDGETAKLQSVYEALTPYLASGADPAPLYSHGGAWKKAFLDWEFDSANRLARLHLRYPAYFTDGEPESRARIETLLQAKAGRDREYRLDWNEEANHLTLTALAPLPTDVPAQRFITAPGEIVLGFTDTTATHRTTPVSTAGGTTRHAPPVIWRTGPRSTEPHLLALGLPGSGITTLLRSLALQALQHGDVVIVDCAATGEYACLAGRPGVLAIETGLSGTLAALEWAAHETERRLIAVNRARQAGTRTPEDTRRPLWIIADRATALTQVAASGGRPDPQTLLGTPLRHGRAAGLTVAAADTLDAADALAPVLLAHTRARVALGPLTTQQAGQVLGAAPATSPAPRTPPGRGYARLGNQPAQRLQVPHTPDPHDEQASEGDRAAVLALLPQPHAGNASPAAASAAPRGTA